MFSLQKKALQHIYMTPENASELSKDLLQHLGLYWNGPIIKMDTVVHLHNKIFPNRSVLKYALAKQANITIIETLVLWVEPEYALAQALKHNRKDVLECIFSYHLTTPKYHHIMHLTSSQELFEFFHLFICKSKNYHARMECLLYAATLYNFQNILEKNREYIIRHSIGNPLFAIACKERHINLIAWFVTAGVLDTYDDSTLFNTAFKLGDYSLLEVACDLPITYPDYLIISMMQTAIQKNYFRFFKKLLTHFSIYRPIIITDAAYYDRGKILLLLLNQNIFNNFTILCALSAAIKGHASKKTLNLLINRLDSQMTVIDSVYYSIIKYNNIDCIPLLMHIKTFRMETLISIAVHGDNIDIIAACKAFLPKDTLYHLVLKMAIILRNHKLFKLYTEKEHPMYIFTILKAIISDFINYTVFQALAIEYLCKFHQEKQLPIVPLLMVLAEIIILLSLKRPVTRQICLIRKVKRALIKCLFIATQKNYCQIFKYCFGSLLKVLSKHEQEKFFNSVVFAKKLASYYDHQNMIQLIDSLIERFRYLLKA
uniref:Multigene family 530 protein n=1 Tax=African swine fever virus TaxID=10497 RepID=Q65113_ASF|nr:multigene family 530 protein [African swine fever virus]